MVAEDAEYERLPVGRLLRYCSRYANRHGAFVGVFGLVNVLGRHGMLTPAEERFRRENNAWYDAAYPDPTRTNPKAYEHPRTASWFRSSPASAPLLTRLPGYLAILDSHRVAWRRITTDDPGDVVYEDEFQVVAVPRAEP